MTIGLAGGVRLAGGGSGTGSGAGVVGRGVGDVLRERARRNRDETSALEVARCCGLLLEATQVSGKGAGTAAHAGLCRGAYSIRASSKESKWAGGLRQEVEVDGASTPRIKE